MGVFNISPHPRHWREQLLNRIISALLVASVVALIFASISAIVNDLPLLLLFYGITFSCLCGITLCPGLSFMRRTGALLALVYLFSTADLLLFGLWGNGAVFLLTLIILTTTLLNTRYGLLAFWVSIITSSLIAWFNVFLGYEFPLQKIYSQSGLSTWFTVALGFVLVCAIAIASIHYLVHYLETELHSQQANYIFISDVMDRAGALVMVLAADGRIIRFNQASSATTGFALAQVYNQPFWDVLAPPPEQTLLKYKFQTLIQTHQPFQYELNLLTPTGQERVIDWSFTGMNAANAATFVVAIGLDTTTRKQTEQERERRLLAEQQQRQFSEAMRQAGLALTSTLNQETLLDRLLDHVGNIVPYDSANIMLIDHNEARMARTRGFGPEMAAHMAQLVLDIPTTHYVKLLVETRRPHIITDIQTETEWGNFLVAHPIRSWAGAPIVSHDKVLAIFTLDKFEPNFYQPEHLERLEIFTSQAALALENARLFEAVTQRVAELEAVRQATLGITAKLKLDAVFNTILETAFQLTPDAQNAHIFLYKDDALTYAASILADGRSGVPFASPRPTGLTYTIAREARTIAVANMKNHPLFTDAPPDWEGSIMGTPLKIGAQIVGVMTISRHSAHAWSQPELRAFELLADQAAIAIENARLYNQTQQYAAELESRVAKRTFELQTLYELTQALSQAHQFNDVLHLAIKHLRQAIPHSFAAGLLITEGAGTMLLPGPDDLPPAIGDQIKNLLQAQVAITPKYLKVQHLPPLAEPVMPDQPGAVLSATLVVEHETVGALLVVSPTETDFSAEHARLLQTIADQAAATIRRLQLLLAAELQRLENIIRDLPNGIILLNADYRIAFTNQTAKSLLPHLKVGGKLAAIGRHPIETIVASATADAPYLVETEAETNQMFEIDANPVFSGPEAGGWTLVIRDVTEDRLNQKRAQQQERLAAVGQLAAGIAHDFNNILTGIIGYAELLLADPRLLPDLRDDAERITKQGHRAAHLVRQILDFSRQTITEKHPLDLVPFVKETIKLLERTLPENIVINFDAPPGEYVITADLNQMQQVLTNLAVNARDAMPAGGTLAFGLAHAEFSAGVPPPFPRMTYGPWVLLTIADTGVGIPQENQEQIFEPFFTTKEVGKGTGLGLAQVYGIIKQHEGFIQVQSRPEAGTTFLIYLQPQPTAAPTAALPAPALTIPRGANQLILMVEDDHTVLEIGTTMLGYLGYRALTATNGYEAISIYQQHQHNIAVVLTDITMPKMGGAELIMALRAQNPAVRIIAITGYPMQNDNKQFIAEGNIDWLQKPLHLKTLAQAIQRILHS